MMNIDIDSKQQPHLNILIGDSLYMTISDFLIPDLQRFGPNAVQYTEKSTLKSILKHLLSSGKSQKTLHLQQGQRAKACRELQFTNVVIYRLKIFKSNNPTNIEKIQLLLYSISLLPRVFWKCSKDDISMEITHFYVPDNSQIP